jgi:glycosyltransferase involved in cell wall biosynthesis
VIKIFDKIQKEIPAKLMMVGDGPEKKKQSICQELGNT